MALVDEIVSQHGFCRIIDLGGTPTYWETAPAFAQRADMSVLIVNREYFTSDDPRITCIVGDATDMSSYSKNEFDLVHSNSVIEHVGSQENMAKMAEEVMRLAPVYYVQAPNYWFPYEFHTRMIGFHWLPKRLRLTLMMYRSCGHYPRARSRAEAQQYVADANSVTYRQMRRLFPDAAITGEKFLGLNKSWMVVNRSR